ncbi:hypothetical protein B0H63DRAFT_77770 [Podospora didyma]|uniref:DUF676 domain-containing protein n=1 Tax=Podospora didyma TaxID=330526 RepID=A0AAE0K223_9PEZI|nr:hypothetical protein B0H63DRAFT_77770 [Podospora didyma]
MDLTAAAYLIFLLPIALLYNQVTKRVPAQAIYLVVFLFLIAFIYNQATKKIPSRLDPDQAPKSRFELVPAAANGLPTRADGFDIIFVHGLGSNPDTTWRATKPAAVADTPEEAGTDSERFVNWVSDFLPGDILPASKDVRIFFYNYDSYWKRDAVNTRLTNLGNELLEHINGEIRISETERSRNLIFVAHSFGGLVVKRALVQAQASREFSHVAEHTKAILFLGTPHRGSSFGPLGWLAAQALQPLGSNPLLLANLEYDSISLHDLHKDFIRTSQDDLRVFNFFEKRPTQILQLWFVQWQRLCVREQSATYEGRDVRNIGLSVDHYGLNKFASKSESYKTILSKLIDVTRSSAWPAKHYYAVPLETVHTYTERAELSTELKRKLQIRHEKASVPYAIVLHGLGGAGKSQLALDYAEKHRDQYNPILWIDAKDEEAVRSSFIRCATELGIRVDRIEKQGSVLTDPAVLAVIQWLRGRIEEDDKWLVIVDNADDVSWGIQKIIPKGNRGNIIITSQDSRSIKLIPGGCERVRVGLMSPLEGAGLLFQHLRLDPKSASKGIKRGCDEISNRLGYLALAIDLAGAHIAENSPAEQALWQYLADYDRHRDELLQMDSFRGLRPTEKTVWTVWDTTLEKITKEYLRFRPDLLLTFLAHFKGSIIQDEMFHLASLGMAAVNVGLGKEVGDKMPAELQQYFSLGEDGWDSFGYRQGCDILLRYNLLQRVEGKWAGVTMHSLVQWRARQSYRSQPWLWWNTVFVLAVCCQVEQQREKPEFRRHLIVHLPDIGESFVGGKDYDSFIGAKLGRIYYDEGRWEEAEGLFVQVMETSKTKLGADHPSTLTSMANLASTYRNQGRWEEAEGLDVQVMEMSKTKLGADHPSTLTSMANLASTYKNQGRWEEAEGLFVQVMETSKTKLGADHPSTLTSMANLASTFWNQGRWEEAEGLEVQVMEMSKTKLGADHPSTLTSMANLASTFWNQGRWEEAEGLFVQVMEMSKTKLGADHPSTLTSMANLASTYRNQGRWEEAEGLEVQVMEMSKTKLGADHPSTLTSMANLASTFWNQGRWEEAEGLFVQVMETSKTKLGADHPDTLTSMANLASTYRNQGRWEEAEGLDVQVMEMSKTKLGADHPDTLTSMANLASTFWNQGRWEEAEGLEVQVMEMSKTKLGADHPSTLTSMANLASTYKNQGRWEEAEGLFVQVMETRKTKLGADHPSTLTSMANLASTYRNQGRWEEAEGLEVQVIETSKTKLGADHPSTLTSMANLASTFWNQGRWEEAEGLFVQVMEMSKTKLGADHPSTLTSMANLASTYKNQGRWEEAEGLEVQVMEMSKTKLGADHPSTLTSMANLASTYRNQGRWEEAEGLFVQVMEMSKTKLGADHPSTLTSMANLASTFWNQGRWEEAEGLEVQVMEMSKTKLGADHPSTLTSMANLAITWKDQGRLADALALLEDCAQAQQRVLGQKHSNTLSSLATIAKWSS